MDFVTGYIREKVDFTDLRSAFADANCAAITTEDVSQQVLEAIASLTPRDIEKMRGVEIGLFSGDEMRIRVQNGISLPVGDDRVYPTYGLPLTLQFLLQSDNEEYMRHAGHPTRTRLVVGDALEVTWHADLSRTAETPIQHRDLSGRGMYMVTSDNGFTLPCNKPNSLNTCFFNETVIRHHINEGNLQYHRQAAGERLLFRHNLAHRSYRAAYEPSLSVPQLRAITSYHLSRA